MAKAFSFFLLMLICFNSAAQNSPFKGFEHLFTTPENYTATYTDDKPIIDGNIKDAVWKHVEWTSPFADIEGDLKPAPKYKTRAKMLWDSNYLYIAGEMKDPHVWATLKKHDAVVFHDNDFEVFLGPGNTAHQYFEIEVNALNTVFDLFLPKPYRCGSGALISWNAPGLKTAVKVQGTLNNPADKDSSWTVEMAIPFVAITIGNDPHIPGDGDIWRINFSRVEWEVEILNGKYVKKKLPENNWVWSPQGVVNMHCPERWGYLQFSHVKMGDSIPAFQMPLTEKLRNYLWLVYYKQQAYKDQHKMYATTLNELRIEPAFMAGNVIYHLQMEATNKQFNAAIKYSDNKQITINEEGLVVP